MLADVWVTMDGLKLSIKKAAIDKKQSPFYNGWTHGHYVSGVFCFAPDGTIPIAFFNMPGCIHDSRVAFFGKIYNKLKRVFDKTGGRCTVDCSFLKGRYPFLIKSGQKTTEMYDGTRTQVLHIMKLNKEATSIRQSAERGMCALQGSFPRLTNRFKFD